MVRQFNFYVRKIFLVSHGVAVPEYTGARIFLAVHTLFNIWHTREVYAPEWSMSTQKYLCLWCRTAGVFECVHEHGIYALVGL